jgi:hypothetical protein
MASSVVAICNMALGHIGKTIFIDSLSENSQAASVCNVFYEPCRDMALADAHWNFASKRVELADLGTPPTNWLYRYALPTDCIEARYLIVLGSRTPLAKDRIPFELAEENSVRVLYTDQEEAELVYTKRQENPNLFSPQFVFSMSLLLASRIVMPLSAAPALADKMLNMYEIYINKARTASLREGQNDVEPDCEFVTGRN